MCKRIGVIAAMPAEVDTLSAGKAWRRSRAPDFPAREDACHLITCAGVGARNARVAAERMVSHGVAALVSIGLGGGLAPELMTGHIVIATDVVQALAESESESWTAHAGGAAGAYAGLTEHGLAVTCGRVVTVPQAAATRDSKATLFQHTGALAVDMESAAVARVACEANLPFFGLRVICDTAPMTVPPELIRCLNADGSVRFAAVLHTLARRPGLLKEMVSMARAFARARTVLGQAWRRLMQGRVLYTLVERVP